MKNKSLIAVFALTAQFGFAQNIIVGQDKMPVSTFAKEYEVGLKNQGINETIDSYVNFKMAQNIAKAMKVDTTQYFRANVANRLNELKKSNYYPKELEDQFLNDYLAASQKESQVQVFYVKKTADDKTDYQKIYNDVKKGSLSMDNAIKDDAKGDPKPIYIKIGTLDWDLDKEVQKLPIGGISKLVDTSEYTAFVKKVAERPSMGYVIFGTVSYANDDQAAKKKEEIYAALAAKQPFQEITHKYGSNKNETDNGGAVMGSPALPDDVYAQMKTLKDGEYTKTPILQDNKYYIFYVYSRRPYSATTPENKEFFFADMMNSQYGNQFFDAFIQRLKKSPSYKETPFYTKAKTSYAEYAKLANDKDVLFSYAGKNFSVGDVKEQIKDHLSEASKMDDAQWGNLVTLMNNSFLMRGYNTEFESRPDVKAKVDEVAKNLYSNYFYTDYIRKQVDQHPEWMTSYYNAHKDKYKKEAAAKGRVIIPQSEADVEKFKKLIVNPADWSKLQTEYASKVDAKGEPVAKFNDGEMVESAEVFQKYKVPFKTGVYTAKIGGRTLIIANDEILPGGLYTEKEALEYDDLKDDVTSDYIKKVLAEERAKVKVVIEPGFVSTLEKNFKK